MIKSVSLKNFKGHNRTFEIGRATMIVGDNFKGKTGLFQAIALGVHGSLRHPTKDRQLEPFGLASGNPMSVEIFHESFEDHGLTPNQSILRKWTQDKRGTVRYEGYDGKPLAAPILLDARTYFDLSADKRMRFVFGAVKLGDAAFSHNKLIADLKCLKVENMQEAHQEALNDVVKHVSDSWEEFDMGVQGDITVQDWLAGCIDSLKERAKLAKQAVDRMAKTVAGMAELQVRDTDAIDANTAALENQLAGIQRQLADKQSELGSLNARIQAAEQQAQKNAGLQAELEKLPVEDTELLAREPELKITAQTLHTEASEINRSLGIIENELQQLKATEKRQQTLANDIATLDADIAQKGDQTEREKFLREDIARLKNESETLRPIHSDLMEKVQKLELQWHNTTQERVRNNAAIKDLEGKLVSLPAMTACPFCSCTGDGFQKTAADHFSKEIETLNEDIGFISKTLSDIEAAGKSLKATRNQAATRLDEIRRVLEERDTDLNGVILSMNFRAKLITRREELLKQVAPVPDATALAQKQADIRQRLTANNAATVENDKLLVTISQMRRREDLAKQIVELQDLEETLQLKDANGNSIKYLKSEAERIDLEIKNSIGLKQDALRQNQAVAEQTKAKAELDMTKLALESVTACQQGLVDTAFGAIIQDANRFTDGILESPLVYREGEIGRMRNGVFVSHEFLSGTEQALTFAAISVALAVQSPFKLCMIDELTKLDSKNKQRVLDRMMVLLEKKVIDQFVAVDTSMKDYGATLPIELTVVQL